MKRDYLIYLKAAKRLSAPSIDKAAAAIDRYLDFGKGRDLKKFHRAHVNAFVEDFVSLTSPVTNKPLSASTINGTLKALRGFAHWLAEQPGYKRAISHTDAEYFGSPEAKADARGSVREKTPPTVEQIHRVIALMPAETEIEKRDRAVVAFTILTGARDAATASFRLKHVDIEQRVLVQDGRESKIKFGKRFRTWFFPVKGEAEAIVGDWVRFLREELRFGP
ncbi:MAG: site-specific integrase, partial [Amphiplicatus sp.]